MRFVRVPQIRRHKNSLWGWPSSQFRVSKSNKKKSFASLNLNEYLYVYCLSMCES